MKTKNEKSPLLPNEPINADIEAGPEAEAVAAEPSSRLAPLTRFVQDHKRALNVTADSLSTLSVFSLVDSVLKGWPDEYKENLNTFNIAFAVYFAVQLALSISYHHSHDEEKKSPLYVGIPALLSMSIVMMSYVLNSLQGVIIAAQAEVTNPEGGPNSVDNEIFWGWDFSLPATIAFAYGATQFGKGVHKLLVSKNSYSALKLEDKVPTPIKKTAHITDAIFEFGVKSSAVYGSIFQNPVSLAVNLLKYPQIYTTIVYGGGLVLGTATNTLFQLKILPHEEHFAKFAVAVGSAIQISNFYITNAEDTRRNGVDWRTMGPMVGFPTIFVLGGIGYAAYHNLCKKPKEAVNAVVAEEPMNQGSEREMHPPSGIFSFETDEINDNNSGVAAAQSAAPVEEFDGSVSASSEAEPASSSEQSAEPEAVIQTQAARSAPVTIPRRHSFFGTEEKQKSDESPTNPNRNSL